MSRDVTFAPFDPETNAGGGAGTPVSTSGAGPVTARPRMLVCGAFEDPGMRPGDLPPVTYDNLSGRGRAVLVCDHADRGIPAHLDHLGLSQSALGRHVAYDIGAAAVTRYLCRLLDAPAVLATFSRLVIDPNRSLDRPDSILPVSDGVVVPGNQGLRPADRAWRERQLYWPYHDAVARELDRRASAPMVPAVIAVHSFTPVFQRYSRPWEIGVLWDDDGRIAVPLIEALRAGGQVCVGDNQPYDGRDNLGGTIERHAQTRGYPHVVIELRQDLVRDDAGARFWAAVIGKALRPILEDGSLDACVAAARVDRRHDTQLHPRR